MDSLVPMDGSRARAGKTSTSRGGWSSAVEAVLRAPLLAKVMGANLLIVVAVLLEHDLFPDSTAVQRLLVVLVFSFLATAALVWLAVRPIVVLEATAKRVSSGDFGARVPLSPVADRAVSQLSGTMNRLLDRVEADRARIQYLAGRSVRARDIERESVARELRDSLAQMVSGIALQIASIRRGKLEPDVDRQLESVRRMVEDLTDQMRGVAEALYPGTISEFGLANALRALGRVVARRSNVVVDVDAAEFEVPLSPAAAGALYRVAEEVMRNVNQHSQATKAKVTLAANDEWVKLDIEDNGRGLDITTEDPFQAGLGLFSARAVLALAGGELQLSGAPAKGTRVTARIPHRQTGKGSWQTTS